MTISGMNDIYKFLAGRIRTARTNNGLTIEQLAETTGISSSFLAYIEANQRKPSLDTVAKLAAALKLSLSDLFENSPATLSADPDRVLVQQFGALVRGKSPSQKATILSTVKALAKSFK